MDLTLDNLERLICHKTQQPTNHPGHSLEWSDFSAEMQSGYSIAPANRAKI